MKLAIFVREELAKPRHRPGVLLIGEFLPPRAHPRGLSAKFRNSPRPPRNLVLKSAQASPTALPREFRVAPCQFPRAPAMCRVPGFTAEMRFERSVSEKDNPTYQTQCVGSSKS